MSTTAEKRCRSLKRQNLLLALGIVPISLFSIWLAEETRDVRAIITKYRYVSRLAAEDGSLQAEVKEGAERVKAPIVLLRDRHQQVLGKIQFADKDGGTIHLSGPSGEPFLLIRHLDARSWKSPRPDEPVVELLNGDAR